MYYEIKKFVDNEGNQISEHTPMIEGESELPKFMGVGYINTPQGPMPVRVDFPEDYTLERCFEEYQEFEQGAVDAVYEKMMAKMNEPQLFVPQQQGGDIIVPN
jgi:hypothetical protein